MQELHPSDSSVSLPLVALLAARDARNVFFAAHIVGLGESATSGQPPMLANESCKDESELLAAMVKELFASASILKQSTALLSQEKALSASLKTAVQSLNDQVLQACEKETLRPETPPRASAKHEGNVESRDQIAQSQVQGTVRTHASSKPQGSADHAGHQQARRYEGSDSKAHSRNNRAKNEIVPRETDHGKSSQLWADAACQISWVESTADKSCQAHDVVEAIKRLQWAARNISQRKLEKSLRQQTIAAAKGDGQIAERLLRQFSEQHDEAVKRVLVAKSAKEQYLLKQLEAMRSDDYDPLPPIPPVFADDNDALPQAERGCFSMLAGKSTGLNAEARATERKKWEAYAVSIAIHVEQLTEQLRHARVKRKTAEQEAHNMHIRSIEVAQFHLDTWVQITEKCQELEALRCGDGARERMERLALQKRVVELHLKVEQLQEVLTGAQHAWKRQVEEMERRDRLCVQEDIEIRARALTAEKALRLALERLRILESERRVWLRTRDAPKEVVRLRGELRKSKAAVAALSASLAFQQNHFTLVQTRTRLICPEDDKKLERIVSTKFDRNETLERDHDSKASTGEVQEDGSKCMTPVAFDHSALEDQLLQLQDAMDALSPEWKREMELRSLRSSKKVSNRNQIRDQPESAHKIWGGLQAERERASSYPLSSSPLKRDDLDDGVLSCTEAAEERDQGTKRNSVHNFPGNGSERKASLVELRHQALSTNGGTLGNQSRSSKRIQPEGHRSKQQVTKMSGTMSILATRNISGTQFNLQEPFVIAEVDGRRISSHVLVPKDSRGGAKIGEQESRQFVFSATEASVIRLSVCGWMSHSRAGQMEMESAIKGIVIIAVADKDWYAVLDSDGVPFRTAEGVVSLELLLTFQPANEQGNFLNYE